MDTSETVQKSDGRNSLWRYFGLTQRAAPAEISNPTEAKLDLLIADLTRLANIVQDGQPGRLIRNELTSETVVRMANDSESPSRLTIFTNIESNEIQKPHLNPSKLSNVIPSKYDEFVTDVREILRVGFSGLNVLSYDETNDVICLATKGMVTRNQVGRITQAAIDSAVKFMFVAAVVE
jgi:hypothetical protein